MSAKHILSAVLGAFVTAIILLAFRPNSENNEQVAQPQMLAFSTTPRFPDHIKIFDEDVDLTRWDNHERYERELVNFCFAHTNTLLTIKRANRYFPILEPILKEEGIPADMIYLCCIESSLNTRAISPVKAAGLWQFMPETGKEHGLQVDGEVDERYHIEKATRAACQYFRNAYEKYHDWLTVAASYNCGQNGMTRRVEKQRETCGLDMLVPEETSRYMFRIMAIKEVMSNPYHYGFVIYPDQLYRPISTTAVKIDASIPDITQWAIDHGTNYYQLKEFNPWLRDYKLTVRPGKSYTILLPNKADMTYNGKDFEVYNHAWVVSEDR